MQTDIVVYFSSVKSVFSIWLGLTKRVQVHRQRRGAYEIVSLNMVQILVSTSMASHHPLMLPLQVELCPLFRTSWSMA
jgi:hypothetical protein